MLVLQQAIQLTKDTMLSTRLYKMLPRLRLYKILPPLNKNRGLNEAFHGTINKDGWMTINGV